jgi:hypothetical protein
MVGDAWVKFCRHIYLVLVVAGVLAHFHLPGGIFNPKTYNLIANLKTSAHGVVLNRFNFSITSYGG